MGKNHASQYANFGSLLFLTVLLLYMPSNVDGVEHAGNAQIHTQKLCSEYFNQIFAFSDAWQMPFNPHLSHFGLRAVHTYRPCRISQWCALGIKASGI